MRLIEQSFFIAALLVGGILGQDPSAHRYLVCFVERYNDYFSYEHRVSLVASTDLTEYQYTIGKYRQTESFERLVPPDAGQPWEQGVRLATAMQAKNVFPRTAPVVAASWTRGELRQDTFTFTTDDGTTLTYTSTQCGTAQYAGAWNNCMLPSGFQQHCWTDTEQCCGAGEETARCCPAAATCADDASLCYSASTATPTTAPTAITTDAPGAPSATDAPASPPVTDAPTPVATPDTSVPPTDAPVATPVTNAPAETPTATVAPVETPTATVAPGETPTAAVAPVETPIVIATPTDPPAPDTTTFAPSEAPSETTQGPVPTDAPTGPSVSDVPLPPATTSVAPPPTPNDLNDGGQHSAAHTASVAVAAAAAVATAVWFTV